MPNHFLQRAMSKSMGPMIHDFYDSIRLAMRTEATDPDTIQVMNWFQLLNLPEPRLRFLASAVLNQPRISAHMTD